MVGCEESHQAWRGAVDPGHKGGRGTACSTEGRCIADLLWVGQLRSHGCSETRLFDLIRVHPPLMAYPQNHPGPDKIAN